MKKKDKSKSRKRAKPAPEIDVDADITEEPKKGRPTTIDYKAFVKAWRDAASVSEVAGAMGVKRNSASAIAARLRRGGVTLKNFPRRGSQPIDVKLLNKIAAGKD